MSTSIIEPGTRLANRYLLEDRVSESGGSTLWKALDEILARPVAIRTFDPDFARVGDVVTAARAASRLTDPRLTQVFDADDSGERAYVVSEWVGGNNLEDLLQAGPMEPERAAALIGEVAEAIAAAHEAGLAHLRLAPANVIWTTGGTVKVTGLSVEAALANAGGRPGRHAQPGPADQATATTQPTPAPRPGEPSGTGQGTIGTPGATGAAGPAAARGEPDPAVVDTRGLGRLLYAAVTAHWPGDDGAPSPGPGSAGPTPPGPPGASGSPGAASPGSLTPGAPGPAAGSPQPPVRLPAAPCAGGEIRPPRQVLPGVPHAIDAVVCRALGIHAADGLPPFTSPAEVAAALDQVPRTPLPLFMGLRPAQPAGPSRPSRTAAMHAPPARSAHGRTPPQPQPPVPSRATSSRVRSPASGPSRSAWPATPGSAYKRPPGSALAGAGGTAGAQHRAGGQINKPLVALASLLAVAVVAVGGWQLSHLGGGGGSGSAKGSPTSSPTAGRQVDVLRVAHAAGFDPKPGDGDEKSERAHLAIDSKPDTAWTTDGYNTAEFGRLKSGVGLLLDMGKDVRVSDVKVTLPESTGSVLQLRVGDEPRLAALDPVAKDTDTNGTIDFHLSTDARGRYVLLWFTKLAPDGGRFRGKISDVVVHGPAD